MRKEEIKKLMIVYSDNDFVRVWDWIGKILLETITSKNICFEEMLEDSGDIEKFVFSILPTAIEFTQYRAAKYEDHVRYRDIDKTELNYLVEDFIKDVKFKYNFSEDDNDYEFGGSETLIIDLEKNQSFIR